MKEEILKHALDNAIRFNGTCNPKAVIGKILGELPDARKDVPKTKALVEDITSEVNSMQLDDQIKKLKELCPTGVEKKKTEKRVGLKELKNAESAEKVIMRFEPSPSGPLHIGHAYVLSLNSEYVRKYNGKLIIRIADTNSNNIYSKSYDLIPEDAKWITKDNVKEIIVQSNNLDLYYEHCLRLLDMGKSYVCTCSADDFREFSKKKLACPCRDNSNEENIKKWHDMFDKYQEGEAVVRLKTDMQHKNPAMRDFPLFRINDSPHPRFEKKYRVWPLMNFSVTVDDHEEGINYIIRAKDHADNAKRQEYIYNYFDWPVPQALFVGRINFEGLSVSCSKTRPLIEDGTYTGWDDIRLPFLPALKRRGYQPEAFIKYAMEVGVTQTDKSVKKEDFFKSLNAFNKELVEEKANRYFFIKEPKKKIIVENAPELEIEMDLHPDHRKGGRMFHTKGEFYVENELEDGKKYRLMNCLNFKYENNKCTFLSKSYSEIKGKAKLIHWLPVASDLIPISILMDDNTITKGLAEPKVNDLEKGAIVQFERFGFCTLDDPENMTFFFLHK